MRSAIHKHGVTKKILSKIPPVSRPALALALHAPALRAVPVNGCTSGYKILTIMGPTENPFLLLCLEYLDLNA